MNAAPFVLQLLGTVLVGSPAAGQTRYHVRRPPAELFAAFVRERASLNDETGAALEITHVLLYNREYPPEHVEYFLKKLEQFALTGSPQWLRGECVYKLTTPGSKRGVYPIPGTFVRLERIYGRSDDPLVKMAVVGSMGTLIETQEASAFLERIATKDSQDFPDASGHALPHSTSWVMWASPYSGGCTTPEPSATRRRAASSSIWPNWDIGSHELHGSLPGPVPGGVARRVITWGG